MAYHCSFAFHLPAFSGGFQFQPPANRYLPAAAGWAYLVSVSEPQLAERRPCRTFRKTAKLACLGVHLQRQTLIQTKIVFAEEPGSSKDERDSKKANLFHNNNAVQILWLFHRAVQIKVLRSCKKQPSNLMVTRWAHRTQVGDLLRAFVPVEAQLNICFQLDRVEPPPTKT